MSIAAFIAVALLHLAVAVSPGPAVLMTARIGVTQGFKVGLSVAVGIGAASVIWAIAALFGLSILFEYAPALLLAFKIAGAGFLLYLAVKLWRHASEPLEAEAGKTARSVKSGFNLGFLTQISNPKPAILFAAIFVGTVPSTAGWPIYVALLTVVFINETLWNAFVAKMFSLPAIQKTYLGLKSVIDRIFGGILAALSLKIAAT